MNDTDLQIPQLYINRELSFLEFNQRVLEQAKDDRIPLLERVRVPVHLLRQSRRVLRDPRREPQGAAGGRRRAGRPGRPVGAEQLKAIRARAVRLVDEQYELLNDVLMPELAQERRGVRLAGKVDRRRRPPGSPTISAARSSRCLSPLALDPARPFPKILNKSLNFAIVVEGEDGFGRNSGLAVVQAPRSLPRLIRLPDELGSRNFVFLGTIVEAFVSKLFAGMHMRGCYQFRVTRNSDLFVEQEEVDDLLRAVEGELASRRYRRRGAPGDRARLSRRDSHLSAGAIRAHRRRSLQGVGTGEPESPDGAVRSGRPHRTQIRRRSRRASRSGCAWAAIYSPRLRAGDVLLHHPFQGFGPVTDFIKQAASDPQVLAIKQTLYRAGSDSAIVGALVEAAQAGKDVTVIIELRARFDEEANIELATKLQEAGAHVMYGVFGYKTHAKLVMVVRREEKGLRRYCHLGTGNYHAKTARLYTDYGLMTADEAIGEDIHEIFLQLTGLTRVPQLRKLLHAPFSLHQALLAKIEREAEHARAGKPARIIAKLNALTEPTIIQALYRASRAGVGVDLIVRGVCCLRPGVPGVSDRIKVRSIVGRFLEHSRVYYFENGGEREIYCGSADWMDRNLFRRIEVAFPVDAPELQARVADDLKLYLADDIQAWDAGFGRAVLARRGRRRRSARPGAAVEPVRRARGAHRRPESAPRQPDDVQAKAGLLQIGALLLEILESERMFLHPALRQLQVEVAALDREIALPAAAAGCVPDAAAPPGAAARSGIPQADPRAAADPRATRTTTAGGGRRPAPTSSSCSSRGNPGMSACCEQVGAVPMVLGVRDVEAGLVQSRRPAQHRTPPADPRVPSRTRPARAARPPWPRRDPPAARRRDSAFPWRARCARAHPRR